jgi:hypothetical protein
VAQKRLRQWQRLPLSKITLYWLRRYKKRLSHVLRAVSIGSRDIKPASDINS